MLVTNFDNEIKRYEVKIQFGRKCSDSILIIIFLERKSKRYIPTIRITAKDIVTRRT